MNSEAKPQPKVTGLETCDLEVVIIGYSGEVSSYLYLSCLTQLEMIKDKSRLGC
jgi:hypothetical protein